MNTIYTATTAASAIPLLLVIPCFALPLFIKQVWQNRNPISSRGISTWIALAVHLSTAITFIIGAFAYETGIACYLTHLVVFPLALVLYSSYIIQVFRYLVLGYVQKWLQKEDSDHTSTEADVDDLDDVKELEEMDKQQSATPAKTEKKPQRSKFGVRVLRRLASNWMYIFACLTAAVVWHIIFWIIFTVKKATNESGQQILNIYSPDRCENVGLDMAVAFNILSAVHGAILLSLLILTWIIKWRQCCNLRRILWHDDPFGFQLEAIALIVCNTIFIIVIDVVVVVFPFGRYINGIIVVVLYSFVNLILMPGIPLIRTFYWDYLLAKQRFVLEQSKFSPCLETLVAICQHRELYNLFKNFAMKEFSVENVLCWKAVTKYQRTRVDKLRYSRAKFIYEMFLHESSMMEVNIIQSMKEEIRNALQTYETNGTISPNLFDRIATALASNLLDIYTRFFKSESFKNFLNK
jgi:hypothetical protein